MHNTAKRKGEGFRMTIQYRKLKEKIGNLSSMFTVNEYRRQGIAKELLTRIYSRKNIDKFFYKKSSNQKRYWGRYLDVKKIQVKF